MLNILSQWVTKFSWRKTGIEVLLSSLVASGLIVTVRQLGGLEFLDLATYDRFVNLLAESPEDERLLTVLITEEDIQDEGKWPLSDATLAKALNIILESNPNIIGIDLYRDLPVEPGSEELSFVFANSDPEKNTFSRPISVVCKLEQSVSQPAVAPPPSLPLDFVGFADIVVDRDGVVRRNLFYVEPQESRCPTPYSFGIQLALNYLMDQGINPEVTPEGWLKIGKTTFQPIDGNIGTYRNIDANGYQVMLDFSRGKNPTPSVSLRDVLERKVSPKLIENKIVLIGVSAPSLKDVFLTPLSNQENYATLIPGVTIHAHMASQFLSSAIDGKRLIWGWREEQELLWIYLWGVVGSVSAFLISRPLIMILSQISGIILIVASGGIIFVFGGWIPVVTPILTFVISAILLMGYNAYQAKQEQLDVQKQVVDQEKSIAVLQMLLQSQSEVNVPSLVPTYDEGSVIVSRYQIVKRLGRKGLGNSYLATDLLLPGKPRCVVKRLNAYSKDPKILNIIEKLLETEAKIVEKIGKHDKIPDLLAYIQDNDKFFLIHEYMEGKNLIQELKEKGKYSEQEVLQMIEEVMDILSFIQQYNIVHRDIKLENVIRRKSDNSLVLIDFGGIKQVFNLKNDGKNSMVSNEGYASPEQLAGQPVMASDIYSVGMVAIHCLTGIFPGNLPRDPETGGIMWDKERYVSPITAQVIDKMTRYHFGDRYQNAQELIKELRQRKLEIQELKNRIDIEIHIDEQKKEEEVAEIVRSEDFLRLQEKAQKIRSKRRN